MATVLYALLYNIFIFPVLYLAFHLYAFFKSKYRKGIKGRYQSLKRISEFVEQPGMSSADIFLIHCSSMGEFEHIKPFVRELKDQLPRCKIVVMFFSPSGYENVKSAPGVDLFIYTPFDGWFTMRQLFRILRPRALIIAKYDVWPNQVWASQSLGIPRFLINATLYGASGRLRPTVRWFIRGLYSSLNLVLTISEEDKAQFTKLIPADKIIVVGDTKYDQVIFRSEESRKKRVLPKFILESKRIFVAGSTWPEDEAHLVPALKHLTRGFSGKLLIIICPHEPTEEHLNQLSGQLKSLRACLYSQIDSYNGQPVIIINQIGLLANLYSVAHVAYVGGSFKQNIHNVLEPAVYGIPVLFGPVNANSREAQLLKETGSGIEVYSRQDIEIQLRKIFENEEYRLNAGRAARSLIEERRGATQRTVRQIITYQNRENRAGGEIHRT